MSEPKISIIIPIYNVEKYLRECLDSCTNQTLKDIEIICVDDASPDNSIKILEEYQVKDSRIKIFRHKKNKNLGAARNTGLEHATGEYIWFVDSDDWIEPTMYEVLLKEAFKNNSKLVACKTQYFCDDHYDETNDTNKVKEYTVSEVLKMLLNNNVVRFEIWNKLWDSETIGNIRFKKGQISEEVYFDFEVFIEFSPPFSILPLPHRSLFPCWF